MTLTQAIKAIRSSNAAYAAIRLTDDDTEYVQVQKKDLIRTIRNTQARHEDEGTYVWFNVEWNGSSIYIGQYQLQLISNESAIAGKIARIAGEQYHDKETEDVLHRSKVEPTDTIRHQLVSVWAPCCHSTQPLAQG